MFYFLHSQKKVNIMAFIKKILLNNNSVSIYSNKTGNTVQILKYSVPNILSRTRSVVYDVNQVPIRCQDTLIRNKKIISSDVYTPTANGKTILKDKNGIKRVFEYLEFSKLVEKFLR